MVESRLDTRPWNLNASPRTLALGLIGAVGVACGPAVDVDGDTEGGTDSESESDTRDTIVEPPTDTLPSSSTTTPPQECNVDSDCAPGFDCEDGECVYDDYDCYDGGDCYCYYGHCQPPYECFDDEECGPGGVCDDNYCEIIEQLRDCDSPLELIPMPNPLQAQGALSLSFVEADGDESDDELVVGTAFAAVLLNPEAEEPVLTFERSGSVLGAAGGDFDGDGASDLALVEQDQIAVLFGVGVENFEVGGPLELSPTQLLATRWDGNGDDLVMLTPQGDPLLMSSSLERSLDVVALPSNSVPMARLVALDYAESNFDEVAAEPLRDPANSGPAVLFDGGGGTTDIGLGSQLAREIAGLSSGDEPLDGLVWTTAQSDWTLVDAYPRNGDRIERAIYSRYETMGAHDIDGDGVDNLVFIGDGVIAAVQGDADTFNCIASAPLPEASPSMVFAFGDLDGDGRDGIVLLASDGSLQHYTLAFTP